MIRYVPLVLLGFLLWTPGLVSAPRGPITPVKLLKLQQKIERKRLTAAQKAWKKSFRGQHIPRAERLEIEHQYKRNMRDLELRQKDQLQEIKDQERVRKAQGHHLYSGGRMIQ
ncbi:MAG: hypothetical protein ACRD2B_12575 [Terriglobia bacterium]